MATLPPIDLNANVWKEVGYNLASLAAKQEAYRREADVIPSFWQRVFWLPLAWGLLIGSLGAGLYVFAVLVSG